MICTGTYSREAISKGVEQVIIKGLVDRKQLYLEDYIAACGVPLSTEQMIFFNNHLCMFLTSIGIVIFIHLRAFLYSVAISLL